MSTQHYSATATREGKWWVVEIGDLGTTQGRSASEAREMAKDLVAAMLDVPLTDVDVEVTFEVGGELGEEVQQALEANYEAELAKTEAASNYRKVVADLKASGLSGADIAAVLEIAPQRVSQLAKLNPDEPRERNKAIRAWARKRGLKIAGRKRTVV